MTIADVFAVLEVILNSSTARAIALSKGGWEGWLQCELWNTINLEHVSTERECPYPDGSGYCDVVTEIEIAPGVRGEFWIEIKAFGILREAQVRSFLRDYANDVLKLDGLPEPVTKLALLIVPRGIGEQCVDAVRRDFPGVRATTLGEVDVFFLLFGGAADSFPEDDD